ncbi:hypothetical protein GCM10010358_11630 [Streptomyces minutiscleroticus]|uniref:Uncharacterized protein n=1 Tax=Streptomyces minutiscleroticus TaxID=68238 RepID=A0A918KFC9_9ACTN|nr:hypothetical protein GCM10010358_11630 [Streptomyces minutiscleroticus]
MRAECGTDMSIFGRTAGPEGLSWSVMGTVFSSGACSGTRGERSNAQDTQATSCPGVRRRHDTPHPPGPGAPPDKRSAAVAEGSVVITLGDTRGLSGRPCARPLSPGAPPGRRESGRRPPGRGRKVVRRGPATDGPDHTQGAAQGAGWCSA